MLRILNGVFLTESCTFGKFAQSLMKSTPSGLECPPFVDRLRSSFRGGDCITSIQSFLNLIVIVDNWLQFGDGNLNLNVYCFYLFANRSRNLTINVGGKSMEKSFLIDNTISKIGVKMTTKTILIRIKYERKRLLFVLHVFKKKILVENFLSMFFSETFFRGRRRNSSPSRRS